MFRGRGLLTTGSGGLAGIDVADNDDVNVRLLLTGKRCMLVTELDGRKRRKCQVVDVIIVTLDSGVRTPC